MSSLVRNTVRGSVFVGIFAALFFVFVLEAYAATYYVAPNGSDSNTGSISAPFATLQKAHNLAQPGDTIYLRGGRHVLTTNIRLTKSGTSGNYIKIFAYPGEKPVLDGIGIPTPQTYSGSAFYLMSASWNHLKGFEVINGPDGGILFEGGSHNNILEDLDVHHNGRTAVAEGGGIRIYGTSSNNLLLNNDSHHNRDITGGNADGFQISAGPGNVLRGNRAWRNSDDGFDFYNVSFASNTAGHGVVIENNWAWENGFDDAMTPLGDGNGFKLGGQRSGLNNSSGGHTVKNNLAWGNKRAGFDENNATIPLTLYNNTAFSNPWRNFSVDSSANHVLKNNLSHVGPVYVSANNVTSHNSWQLPVTVDASDFVSLSDTVNRGGRAADNTLPQSTFLRLAPGSDLIDKGTPVGSVYSGVAPDLGAYEVETQTPPADTTAPSTPTGLIGTAVSPTQINLSWVASTDAVGVVGYRVFRNNTQVATVSGTTFSNTGLTAGTSYSYRVAAYDAAGNVSAQSLAFTIATPSAAFSLTVQAVDFQTKSIGDVQSGLWNLYTNGHISHPITFPATGTYTFDISAKGTKAKGEWSKMRVSLNNSVKGTVTVNSTSLKTYRVTMTNVPAGQQTLKLEFINDYYDAKKKEDRNLLIEKVLIKNSSATSWIPGAMFALADTMSFAGFTFTAIIAAAVDIFTGVFEPELPIQNV